jgi:chaperonin GroEL (HSP60 family)
VLQVVVSGGNIGEMAMHFLEKYGLLAIRIPSKFDLRRFCRATGSVALVKLQTPKADELGFAKQVCLLGLCCPAIEGRCCHLLPPLHAAGSR